MRWEWYGILNEVETVQQSRENNEHILPSNIPSNAQASSGAETQLALKYFFNMLVHEPSSVMPVYPEATVQV